MKDGSGYLIVVPWDVRRPGGVTNVVNNLAKQFQRSRAFTPTVLVSSWNDRHPRENLFNDIPVIYVRYESPCEQRFEIRILIAYLLKLPKILTQFAKLIRRYRIGIVNLHYPGLGGLSFVLLRWLRIFRGTLILSFHGLDIKELESQHPIKHFLWHLLLGESEFIVTCSESLAERLTILAPYAQSKIKAIHNGIDVHSIEAELDDADQSATYNGPYILNVGTFEHKKGQDVLVKAFAALKNDYPDLRLVLVGADGPTKQDIQTLANRQGDIIANSVDIVVDADHSTVMSYMAGATLFVLPSRDEPFGIVLLEAGLSEVAIIASRVGGIPEIIKDSRTGLLVEPNDVDELKKAIRLLLSDTGLRKMLAQRHRRMVVDRFTWERCAREYVDLANFVNQGRVC